MLKKITQEELNQLLSTLDNYSKVQLNGLRERISFKKLLEDKGFFPDLSELNVGANEGEAFKIFGIDLKQGVNLSNLDLREIDFTRSNLTRVGLMQCNFESVKLVEAKLSNAILINANLSSANLSGASLDQSDIWDVKFLWANLKNANFIDVNGSKADFSGANLTNANFSSEVSKEDALYDMRKGSLGKANFREAKLNCTKFNNANLAHADFRGADLVKVNFSGADLRWTKFNKEINFKDYNFDGADLGIGNSRVRVYASDRNDTRGPTSTRYNGNSLNKINNSYVQLGAQTAKLAEEAARKKVQEEEYYLSRASYNTYSRR